MQSKHPPGPSVKSLLTFPCTKALCSISPFSCNTLTPVLRFDTLGKEYLLGGRMKLNNKPTPNQQLLKRSQQGYSSKEWKSFTHTCSYLQSAIASSFLLRVKWQMFLIHITASWWKLLTLKWGILMKSLCQRHAHSGSRHALMLCSYSWAKRHLSSQRHVPNSNLLQESDLESVNLPEWPMLSTSPATICLEKH